MEPTVTLTSIAAETGKNLGTVAFHARMLEVPDRTGAISADAAESLRQVLHAGEPWRRPTGMDSPGTPAVTVAECVAAVVDGGLFDQPLPDWVPDTVRDALVAEGLLDHRDAQPDSSQFAQWHGYAAGTPR